MDPSTGQIAGDQGTCPNQDRDPGNEWNRQMRNPDDRQAEPDQPEALQQPEDHRDPGERQEHEKGKTVSEREEVVNRETRHRQHGQPQKCLVLDLKPLDDRKENDQLGENAQKQR